MEARYCAAKNTCASIIIVLLFLLGSCTSSKNFNANKKYSPETLKDDYTLFRNILEESHPSLYWYTSKDSMNYYFNAGYNMLTDSMNEPQFRSVLSYVISKMRCGHTTTRYSKKYTKYLDTARRLRFPLALKFLEDTVVVISNLNKKDSTLRQGTVITSINKIPINWYRDSLMQYISPDGYNQTFKRQSLSNGYNFGYYYANVFGLPKHFEYGYLDSIGNAKNVIQPVYKPTKEEIKKDKYPAHERRIRKRHNASNFQINLTDSIAWLTVNSFSSGFKLRRTFRQFFKAVPEAGVKQLCIDVRNNGGGEVNNSILLTKYLIDKKFKVADSLYAIKKRSNYGKYIQSYFWNKLLMHFITHKKADGKFHFGYFERKYFRPKRKNHYDGNIYIITGGNSFSATTLFTGSLKGQKNVVLVGEETGGAEYGNSAWIIPNVTLPNTKIRFRLPKFRMVVDSTIPETGHGIIPDVEVSPNVPDLKNGIDVKMEKVKELIQKSKGW